MNIKIARLVTGDDVIADILEYKDSYRFKKPVKIVFTERGLGMMPLSPLLADDEVVIHGSHILFIGAVEPDLANEYNAKFGNGLVVPSPTITLSE